MAIKRILCVALLLLIIFNVAFATTQATVLKNNPIELISPALSSKGEVSVDKHLQISVRLESDLPMVMSLTKIETTIVDLEKISALPDAVLGLSASQFSTLEKMKNYMQLLDGYDEGTEAEQLKLKRQIQDSYDLIYQDYTEKKSKYDVLLSELKIKYGPNLLILAAEKPALDSRFSQLNKLADEVKIIETKYRLIKPLYDRLFERSVLKEIPVQLEGIMPYFNYEVKDLKSGKYRLDFYFQNNLEKTVSSISFDAKSRQDTVLSILNSIQSEIDEIWKIKQ